MHPRNTPISARLFVRRGPGDVMGTDEPATLDAIRQTVGMDEGPLGRGHDADYCRE